MMDDPTIFQIEDTIRASLEQEPVSLEPDAQEVAELEQHLPAAWLQEPGPERSEYTPEELQHLLEQPVELPEGDIDELAREAIRESNIDVKAIFDELPDLSQEQLPEIHQPDHDHDFGRRRRSLFATSIIAGQARPEGARRPSARSSPITSNTLSIVPKMHASWRREPTARSLPLSAIKCHAVKPSMILWSTVAPVWTIITSSSRPIQKNP
jgi:hypothetical protein